MPGPVARAPAPTKPTDPQNIPMGMRVLESVTKFEGIVTQRLYNGTTGVRYAVQPSGDGQTLPEAIMMDYHTMLIVDKGMSDLASPILHPTSIRIGDEVKHRISGFSGIVVSRAEFFNGCEYLAVQGKGTKDNPKGDEDLDMAGKWEKIGDGLNKGQVKAAAKVVEKASGGPMTRLARPTAFRG